MTNTMLDVAPKAPPAHVQLAVDSLITVLSEVEDGLVTRIDEGMSTRIERSFDIFVDGVWCELRDRLQFYQYFLHEGTAMFTQDDREKLDFDERLDEARSAAEISDRLFADGTDFLRERYPEQATHMATRLDWLEAKQLEPQLEELVSPKFLTLMKVCQHRYEAMVNQRNSRDPKSSADLQVLRQKLRVQLYAYCSAVGSMLDGTPESAGVVAKALRPILVVRAQVRRKLAGMAPGENDLELVDPASSETEDELDGELDDGADQE